MIRHVKIIGLLILLGVFYQDIQAQEKKNLKKPAPKTTAVIFTPKEFGSFSSVSDINDITETNAEYQSLKNLIDKHGVTIAYADNTFRPSDPLRRGDFIVSFNSALEIIKKSADAGGLNSSVIKYDKSQSHITDVSEIKDLKQGSIYYPAAQSLIEKWAIAAPFSKSKMLNAGAAMQESEVYDVLKSTLGYNSSANNPYASAMSRSKFAMVLNNALNLKLSQINSLAAVKKDSLDELKLQESTLLKQQDKTRKDSLAREAQLVKIQVQKKEAEAWNKMSDKEKKKRLKSESSK